MESDIKHPHTILKKHWVQGYMILYHLDFLKISRFQYQGDDPIIPEVSESGGGAGDDNEYIRNGGIYLENETIPYSCFAKD